MTTHVVLTAYRRNDLTAARQVLDQLAPALGRDHIALDPATGKAHLRVDAPAATARELVRHALDAAAPHWQATVRLS